MASCSLKWRVAQHPFSFFFFFNDTATTEIYTLSLHDALPICGPGQQPDQAHRGRGDRQADADDARRADHRSEEHTSELQSPCNLVCRLLLEKKKNQLPYSSENTELIMWSKHCHLYLIAQTLHS